VKKKGSLASLEIGGGYLPICVPSDDNSQDINKNNEINLESTD